MNTDKVLVSKSMEPKEVLSEPSDYQIAPSIEMIKEITTGKPELIKDFFEKISFDGYSKILNELNGYYRNINNNQMDGSGLTADGYMPPDPADRVSLLQESFDKAISQDSIEKCATILGLSILTIHPYEDGNGRTSRTIFALLMNGYSGSDIDKELFSIIGDRDNGESHRSNSSIINLDPCNVTVDDDYQSLADLVYYDMEKPAVAKRFGDDLTSIPIRVGISNRDYAYNQNALLNEDEQRRLQRIFGSGSLGYCACLASLTDETLKKSIRQIELDNITYNVISYRRIIDNIDPSELYDLEKSFRAVRIDYVNRMNSIVDKDDFLVIFNKWNDRLESWRLRNIDKNI